MLVETLKIIKETNDCEMNFPIDNITVIFVNIPLDRRVNRWHVTQRFAKLSSETECNSKNRFKG